jgi:hypothetical protein
MLQYYLNLELLLQNTQLLTSKDVPHLPPGPKTFEDLQFAYDTYYLHSGSELKRWYETYGVIFTIPSEFRSFFKVDSTWVLGSEPLPHHYAGQEILLDFRKPN